MAKFDFTITDADVGTSIGPPNAFLTDLSMTQSPTPSYETPRASESRQCWLNAYLVLRGSEDCRDLYCCNPSAGGIWFSWGGSVALAIVNHSLAYRGNLVVVSVPRGSTWSVTLSDVENPRAPTTNYDMHNFSNSNYKPVWPSAGPKSNRRVALEQLMRPKQLGSSHPPPPPPAPLMLTQAPKLPGLRELEPTAPERTTAPRPRAARPPPRAVKTLFTIDDRSVGTTLPIADGFCAISA